MTEQETRAVERIIAIAERIEEFRMVTAGRKSIPASMLQELRMARKQVKSSCGI